MVSIPFAIALLWLGAMTFLFGVIDLYWETRSQFLVTRTIGGVVMMLGAIAWIVVVGRD